MQAKKKAVTMVQMTHKLNPIFIQVTEFVYESVHIACKRAVMERS